MHDTMTTTTKRPIMAYGNTSHTRFAIKKIMVVLYLAYWGWSTKALLCDFLGVQQKGQTKFWKTLEDAKIVYPLQPLWMPVLRNSQQRETVYGLASKGIGHAKDFFRNPDYVYKTNVKKIKYPRASHHMLCQTVFNHKAREHRIHTLPIAIMFNGFLSEKDYGWRWEIRKGKNKMPDFVFKGFLDHPTSAHCYNSTQVSHEIECSNKKEFQIYDNFRRIMFDISQGRYHACQYWFLDEKIMDRYRDLYLAPQWGDKYRLTVNENGWRLYVPGETVPVGHSDRVTAYEDGAGDWLYYEKVTFHLIEVPETLRKYIYL